MPRILGKILDSAGRPLTCKLSVRLADSLIFTAPQFNELRLPVAGLSFDIPEGFLDIELIESATQRTTYDFHLYVPQVSTLYYELDGEPYVGPTHEDGGTYYTGSALTPGRRELFAEVLEGQLTIDRFNAIVPVAATVQFSALKGQAVTAARFVDRGYYREIIAGLPGVGEALNQNIYAPYSELLATQQLLSALQTQVDGLGSIGSPGAGAGVSNVRLPFPSVNPALLSFANNLTAYGQKAVTGSITFGVATGEAQLPGSTAIVRLIADGSNTPVFSAFKQAIGSADYDSRAGFLNVLNFWYDGADYWLSILQQVSAIAQPVVDTTPPVLQSAVLNATDPARIDLTYDELLNPANVPALTAYTATGRTATTVSVSSNVVSVFVSAALAAGSSVTFAYTSSGGSDSIQDLAGNRAASFSQTITRAGAADTIPPVLQSVTLDGTTFNKIYFTYNETLSAATVPAISAFTTTGKTITAIGIAGATVTQTLSTAFAPGETSTASYVAPTANKIQDIAGNPAANFSQAISRPAATDTTPPVLQSAALNTTGFAQIILTYNEALNASSVPDLSAFALTNQTLGSVAISGSNLTVGLSAPFPEGATETFTYIVPATNKIQDLAGNPAASISQQLTRAVSNLDADFRLGGMPAGFSTVNLISSSFSGAGLFMTAPSAGDWGNGLLIGPVWNQARPLSIYLLVTSNGTNNFGGGISVEPINWLNRGGAPDTLIAIRKDFYYSATNIKAFTAPAANSRMRYDFEKIGADIQLRASRWDGSAYVQQTGGLHLAVGTAASVANSRIFVDAYKYSITVERVVN